MIYTYINSEGANHPRTEAVVRKLVNEAIERETTLVAFTSMPTHTFTYETGDLDENIYIVQPRDAGEVLHCLERFSNCTIVCSILKQLVNETDSHAAYIELITSLCNLARKNNINLYLFVRNATNALQYQSDFMQDLESGKILKNNLTDLRPI